MILDNLINSFTGVLPALYIHIPFCGRVCPFCAFAVVKDRPEKHSDYIELLTQELRIFQPLISKIKTPIESVYFGGGTPSNLTIKEVEKILKLLQINFSFTEKAEWSFELNPENVTLEYASSLRELGFNRVSLGVQSFNDHYLKNLDRIHTQSDSKNAIKYLRQAGFENINLDFMFGHLYQNLDGMLSDLENFFVFNPNHISAYCLNIEPKTKLARKDNWINWQEEQEELLTKMYLEVIKKLEAKGFNQYEVSNFSIPGKESRQNVLNWAEKNYLGLGVGAHSKIDNYRFGNLKRLVDYKKSLKGVDDRFEFFERLGSEQIQDEYLMVRLRLKEGVNLKEYEERFGQDLVKNNLQKLEMFQERGYLKFDQKKLILTPSGLLLADEISAILAD